MMITCQLEAKEIRGKEKNSNTWLCMQVCMHLQQKHSYISNTQINNSEIINVESKKNNFQPIMKDSTKT